MTEEEMKARIEELETSLSKAESEKKAALGEKFTAAKALKDAQEAAEGAAEEAERAKGDIAALEKRLNDKFQKQLDDANKRAEAAEAGHRSYKAETAIAQAIAAGNVESDHTTILTSHFKSLLDDEGNIEGKSVQDYAKAFFAKDGARYCRAPNNSGAGATGGDTAPATKPFNETEYAIMKRTDPAGAAAWATSTGNGYLNR